MYRSVEVFISMHLGFTFTIRNIEVNSGRPDKYFTRLFFLFAGYMQVNLKPASVIRLPLNVIETGDFITLQYPEDLIF